MVFFDWSRRFDADSMATIALYAAMVFYKIPVSSFPIGPRNYSPLDVS